MEWHNIDISVDCFKCGKEIRAGRKVGVSSEYKAYCWRCGHNIELAQEHRFIVKVNREALSHLGAIQGRHSLDLAGTSQPVYCPQGKVVIKNKKPNLLHREGESENAGN